MPVEWHHHGRIDMSTSESAQPSLAAVSLAGVEGHESSASTRPSPSSSLSVALHPFLSVSSPIKVCTHKSFASETPSASLSFWLAEQPLSSTASSIGVKEHRSSSSETPSTSLSAGPMQPESEPPSSSRATSEALRFTLRRTYNG